jgi:ABC-type glycerol-3-phosphate transport system permease component
MPIISRIGRRNWRVRLLLGAIYAALATGAASMVYPFLLMIAGSTKSAVDAPAAELVPRFLVDDTALYQKYTEGLFNELLSMMQSTYNVDAPTFAQLTRPEGTPTPFVDAWADFLRETAPAFSTYTLGFLRAQATRGVQPYHLRQWKRELIGGYGGSIELLNRDWQTAFVGWNNVDIRPEDYLVRRSNPDFSPLSLAYRAYKERQPLEDRFYFSVEGFFLNGFLKNRYTRDLSAYNASHGTTYTAWSEVRLDERYPDGPGRTDAEREDWETFVRMIVNLQWLQVDGRAAAPYHAFLLAKYKGLAGLARTYGRRLQRVEDLPLPVIGETQGLAFSDWDAFVQGWRDPDTGQWHRLPLESVRIDSLESRFRAFLRQRHGELPAVNAALGTRFAAWSEVYAPQQAFHDRDFSGRTASLRWELSTRNFVTVWDYIVLRGRGVANTAIYCLLAVLVALLVNPLAAYALSRYRPPSAYKVLLFLMMTMAFPPMVTQIPVFLLLRQFDLLNTFWALILPGLANGYSIFLLKGFFDSLPKELYESAEIDGAGEFRIFWQITMSLSQPILAVIALNAFTLAYSNFMFALLICQDEKMWTLMPWLYQLQQYSGQGVVYASLLIAAIPTFVIFALCQNVIMRGIVVPVEK